MKTDTNNLSAALDALFPGPGRYSITPYFEDGWLVKVEPGPAPVDTTALLAFVEEIVPFLHNVAHVERAKALLGGRK